MSMRFRACRVCEDSSRGSYQRLVRSRQAALVEAVMPSKLAEKKEAPP